MYTKIWLYYSDGLHLYTGLHIGFAIVDTSQTTLRWVKTDIYGSTQCEGVDQRLTIGVCYLKITGTYNSETYSETYSGFISHCL